VPILTTFVLFCQVGLSPGAYIVKLRHTECDTYDMGSFTIIEDAVPVAPSVSGNTEFCIASNVALTADHIDAISWEWEKYVSATWTTIDRQYGTELTFAAVDGMTQVRAGYYNANGCLSDFENHIVVIEPAPAIPNISGTFLNICEGSEVQNYAVTGAGDLYEWEADNGVLNTSVGSSVTVTWNPNATSWALRSRAVRENGDAYCPGVYQEKTITLRKDVQYFTAGGDEYTCFGETGNITLLGSQLGSTYYLFQNNIQVPGSANAGTNGLVTWYNFDPGTYEIRLLHPFCGYYTMGSHTIGEKSVKSAPSINGTTDVCDGSNITLTASTGNTSQSWVWSKYQSNSWSELDGQTVAEITYQVNTNITKFRVAYYDEFGCISSTQDIAINVVNIPSLPEVMGNNDSDDIFPIVVDSFFFEHMADGVDQLIGQ